MNINIEGIDFPKGCADCPFCSSFYEFDEDDYRGYYVDCCQILRWLGEEDETPYVSSTMPETFLLKRDNCPIKNIEVTKEVEL